MLVPFTVAEYFAGIGLVRLGLEKAGWRVVFANDISDKKLEMYKAFYPDSFEHYVVGDVFDLDPNNIPSATLATCSFPCIDLSLAGNMNGLDGRHSSAFWGFIKAIKGQGSKAPQMIMVENVPGWLYSNRGADFRITVKALNDLGYVCDVFTLDALRFTPQSRLRVFLVGAKEAFPGRGVADILARPDSLLPASLRKVLMGNLDLNWMCRELPPPPKLLESGLASIVERLADNDPRWWPHSEVERHLQMMDESHHERVVSLSQRDEISYRTFYRRIREGYQRAEVRNDDLAGCLRTAIGGSGKQFLVECGKGRIRMRAMTAREYARLQGVPDSYPITVNGVQALTGFGDAVCAPVISWIAQNMLNPLAEEISCARQLVA